MGVRDEELKRLEQYAKGLGIRVVWKEYVPHTHTRAEWVSDGTEITMYTRKNDSKVKLILTLIHELSHHLGWVWRGRPGSMKSDQILIAADEGQELTKDQRKILYQEEVGDYVYRENIYEEVGVKIPKYIFLADIDLDKYIYRTYYLTGKYPTYKRIQKKKKELLAKYKASR